MHSSDVVVAGAGILGTAIAIELKRRNPSLSITVCDKERVPAYHASGRNSGVIHAGFYYAPGSLKARMCAEGNRDLTAFCEEHRIPLLKAGKLVVAKDEKDLAMLATLHERGRQNGATVEKLDLKQARDIEPRVKTFESALWSPRTAVADPVAVLATLQDQGRRLGVTFEYGVRVVGRKSPGLLATTAGDRPFGFLVNVAGLQADQLAHSFGAGNDYAILPFKGLYLYASTDAPAFRTNIYPVPDMRYPFLGVHVTLSLHGTSKLGPTAIPALWREQYAGLSRFSLAELGQIMTRQIWFLGRNFSQFSAMAVEEFSKYHRSTMAKKAQSLATGIEPRHYRTWGKTGIRAQLVNIRNARLEMDFLLEGNREALHVLNAVSPGWTCSFPFARYVCDLIDRSLERGAGTEPYHMQERDA